MVQIRLTKKCERCDRFIPDEYTLCDHCLLNMHGCEEFYDEVVVMGGGYIYEGVPTNQVVAALRKYAN